MNTGSGLHGRGGYTIEVLGESYVLLECLASDADDRWRHAHSMCRALERLGYPGIVSMYPAYDSVLVEFDPLRIDADGMRSLIDSVAAAYSEADEAWLLEAVLYRLPVLFGHDIASIAEELEITTDALVEQQCAAPFRIRCRAVGGGLMLLNHPGLSPVRRLASPVMRETFGGEFNMAGNQCSIGLAVGKATTGWRTLGRTPTDVSAQFLRADSDDVGDLLQLEPITADDWSQYAGRPVSMIGAAS